MSLFAKFKALEQKVDLMTLKYSGTMDVGLFGDDKFKLLEKKVGQLSTNQASQALSFADQIHKIDSRVKSLEPKTDKALKQLATDIRKVRDLVTSYELPDLHRPNLTLRAEALERDQVTSYELPDLHRPNLTLRVEALERDQVAMARTVERLERTVRTMQREALDRKHLVESWSDDGAPSD